MNFLTKYFICFLTIYYLYTKKVSPRLENFDKTYIKKKKKKKKIKAAGREQQSSPQ